jgi:hypothetical protein
MKLTAAMLVLLTSSQVANAQTTNAKSADPFFDPALRQLGVYLTAPVANEYRRSAANKFSKGAAQAGFSGDETQAFSKGMITGDIRFEQGGKWGRIVSGDPNVRIDAEPGRTKAGYLTSFSTVQSATEFLEKFSTIKLIVKPAPPRDYKVIVNGEECPATEAGIYKVMPGESVINASRPDKPKCEWHGSIAAGAIQQVDCSL